MFARMICLMLVGMPAVPVAFAQDNVRIPAFVLQLPESTPGVFIADTSAARIYQFEQTDGGLTLGHDGYMSIGLRGAGKERAWDRRTPLGIYFVVDQLDTSRMHEQYGITAFPLDYPNAWDRRLERTGDGIWVHGVVPGGEQRPPFDTDGCIALPNEDLGALEDDFLPLTTPVIVTRNMTWESVGKLEDLRMELVAAIGDWAEHYATANVHAYLSMYAPDFRYRGMGLAEWASFRMQTLEERGAATVNVEELLLLVDPEEEGLYLSRFVETIDSASAKTRTMKRLYWRRTDDGRLRIVAEDNG